MTPSSTAGSGRETRLLLLVILVAVAILLVLARFRFPEDTSVITPAAGPIERIAARATFEDLALVIASVSARVQPSMVAVTLDRQVSPPPRVNPRRTGGSPVPVESRMIAGLRIAADLALIHLPPDYQVRPESGVEARAVDADHQLALVQVPATADPFIGLSAPAMLPDGPGYVVLAEGGRGGASFRPVFIGRLDALEDPRWAQPLMGIGGEPQIPGGSFVFSLEGRLIGLTMPDAIGRSLVPTAALEAATAALLKSGGGVPAPGGSPQG